MKLTIKSGADHTEVVRYESNAVGFVAISGITRGALLLSVRSAIARPIFFKITLL